MIEILDGTTKNPLQKIRIQSPEYAGEHHWMMLRRTRKEPFPVLKQATVE